MAQQSTTTGTRGAREPTNFVHQARIHEETVKKEMRVWNPYKNFTINPFKPMYTITGKPNSFQDAEMDCGPEDETMKKIISLSQKPPTEKYIHPQTSSQEYGWMTQPLIKTDYSDSRLHHHRRGTDVTKTKEAEWRLDEQNKNYEKLEK